MGEKDEMWFAPKRYGYGAGQPLVWQGWALLAAHIGLIVVGGVLLHDHRAGRLLWTALFALLPLPIYAAKTRGGWKWRWGRRD